MTLWRASVLSTALLLLACGQASDADRLLDTDGAPADLRASAAAFYEQYGATLAAHRRDAISKFYHPDGAIVVFNGARTRETREEIHQGYLNGWTPPAYFAWEELVFDSISPGQVIVTGGFRWQGPMQPDTSRYRYASLLVAVDSGMAIVFEHETLRPPRD